MIKGLAFLGAIFAGMFAFLSSNRKQISEPKKTTQRKPRRRDSVSIPIKPTDNHDVNIRQRPDINDGSA